MALSGAAGAAVRRLAADSLALIENRLAIVSLDVREAIAQTAATLMLAAAALSCAILIVVLAAFFVVVAAWETNRLGALAGVIAVLVLAGGVCWLMFRRRLAGTFNLFGGIRAELAKDRASLGGDSSTAFQSQIDRKERSMETASSSSYTPQESTIPSSNGSGNSTTEALAQAYRKVLADGEELLRATANYSAEGLSTARDRLRRSMDEARVKASNAQSVITERANQATAATREYVTDNPWKSLAVAATVGIVLGLLLNRNSE